MHPELHVFFGMHAKKFLEVIVAMLAETEAASKSGNVIPDGDMSSFSNSLLPTNYSTNRAPAATADSPTPTSTSPPIDHTVQALSATSQGQGHRCNCLVHITSETASHD